MPGRMDDNLRRAYMQEELGVYLLRGLAAVAQVPRPQDVGIDAIATLLTRTSTRSLVATRSFYVQLKAGSVRTVDYDADALPWLKELKLPFFIGSVDPARGELSLYSSHRVYPAIASWDYRAVRLHLGTSAREAQGEWESEEFIPGGCPQSRRRIVWLGHPVLTWSVCDLTRPEFIDTARRVLESMLEVEERNVRWRAIKYAEKLSWETNQAVTRTGWEMASHGLDVLAPAKLAGLPTALQRAAAPEQVLNALQYDEGNQVILSEMAPFLKVYGMHCIRCRQQSDWGNVKAFVDFLRLKGIDPDRERSLDGFEKSQLGGT